MIRWLIALAMIFAIVKSALAQAPEPSPVPPPEPRVIMGVPYLSQHDETRYGNDCLSCAIASAGKFAGWQVDCTNIFGVWVDGAVGRDVERDVYLPMKTPELMGKLNQAGYPVVAYWIDHDAHLRHYIDRGVPVVVAHIPSAVSGWKHAGVVYGYDRVGDGYTWHFYDPANVERTRVTSLELFGDDGRLRIIVWGSWS